MHSSRDDKNAVDAAIRSRELRARASMAAQNDVKNWSKGESAPEDERAINCFYCE